MTARPLLPADEAAFLRLLRSTYGESYSYQDLYQPGGLGRLLNSGKASLFGDFNEAGELFSHTAFLWKDPRKEYAESGMSFRNARRKGSGRTPEADSWAMLLSHLPPTCAYLHQNTTTLHPLAERYAIRHMAARTTGWIADYTVGERLSGFEGKEEMQSLTLSSALPAAPASRRVLLPETPWTSWLTPLLESWGRSVRPLVADESPMRLGLAEIENNPWISLRRRAFDWTGDGLESLPIHRPRTDLLHLPLDLRSKILPFLLKQSYLPVGFRPHAHRPDELILQYLPPERRPRVLEGLSAARVRPVTLRFFEDWARICAAAS